MARDRHFEEIYIQRGVRRLSGVATRDTGISESVARTTGNDAGSASTVRGKA